jgi:hypothetical protein
MQCPRTSDSIEWNCGRSLGVSIFHGYNVAVSAI